MKTVMYGLKNLHVIPVATETSTTITYGTPIPVTGGVSLSLSPQGETVKFEADDNAAFFGTSTREGYDGTLTVTGLPEGVYAAIYGRTLDAEDNTIRENIADVPIRFALTGERTINRDGTAAQELFALPYCIARQLPYESETGAKKNPKTQSLPFAADAQPVSGDTLVTSAAAITSTAAAAWHTAAGAWI